MPKDGVKIIRGHILLRADPDNQAYDLSGEYGNETRNRDKGFGIIEAVRFAFQPLPSMPFGVQHQCVSLGDMHGNALKLLFLMIINGAAAFPHAKRPPDEYKRVRQSDACQQVKAYDFPFTYYQLFRQLYNKPSCDWDKSLVDILEHCLGELKINPYAHLRLLGDEFADRGMSDVITFKLLIKFAKGGAKLEILLSNHGVVFIKLIEAWFRQGCASTVPLDINANEQYGSINALVYWLNLGWITKEELQTFYEQVYTKALTLISYDLDEQGQIIAWGGHAPLDENEVIDMGRGALFYLSEEANQDLKGAETNLEEMKSWIDTLKAAQQEDDGPRQSVEKLPEFKKLIDALNTIFKHNMKNKTVTRLVDLGFDKNRYTKSDRNTREFLKTGDKKDAFHYPFHTAMWNRVQTDEVEGRTALVFYGHTMQIFADNICCLDNTAGKAPPKYESRDYDGDERAQPLLLTPSTHEPEPQYKERYAQWMAEQASPMSSATAAPVTLTAGRVASNASSSGAQPTGTPPLPGNK